MSPNSLKDIPSLSLPISASVVDLPISSDQNQSQARLVSETASHMSPDTLSSNLNDSNSVGVYEPTGAKALLATDSHTFAALPDLLKYAGHNVSPADSEQASQSNTSLLRVLDCGQKQDAAEVVHTREICQLNGDDPRRMCPWTSTSEQIISAGGGPRLPSGKSYDEHGELSTLGVMLTTIPPSNLLSCSDPRLSADGFQALPMVEHRGEPKDIPIPQYDKEICGVGFDDSDIKTLATLGNGKTPLRTLILKALKGAPKRSLTMERIQAIIKHYFAYYREDETTSTCIERILQQYDFPTVPTADNDGNLTFESPPNGYEQLLDVQPQFDPSRPNKILDLPSTVRLHIWHSVMELPLPRGSAWSINPAPTIVDLRRFLQGKSLEPQLTKPEPFEPPVTGAKAKHLTATVASGKWKLQSRPMQSLLALAMVNKQLYDEAMPVFYGVNTFHFACEIGLEVFLRGMPSRRMFLKSISIHYDPPQFLTGSWRRTFKLLQETGLKYLRLELREESIMAKGEGCSRVEQMPGFTELGKVRGVETIQLVGSFQRTKKFLGKLMRKRGALDDKSTGAPKERDGQLVPELPDYEQLVAKEYVSWRKMHAKAVARRVKENARERAAAAKEAAAKAEAAQREYAKAQKKEQKRLALEYDKLLKAQEKQRAKADKEEEKRQAKLQVQRERKRAREDAEEEERQRRELADASSDEDLFDTDEDDTPSPPSPPRKKIRTASTTPAARGAKPAMTTKDAAKAAVRGALDDYSKPMGSARKNRCD